MIPHPNPQSLQVFLRWQRGSARVNEGSRDGESLLITPKCDHKGPDERKAEGDVTTEENSKRWGGGTRGCSEVLGRWRKGPQMRNTAGRWPLRKAREGPSVQSLQRKQPCGCLDFSPVRPITAF